jgi:hypothetical protein
MPKTNHTCLQKPNPSRKTVPLNDSKSLASYFFQWASCPPVQIGVAWPVHVEVALADVEDGLVVHHEGAVRVLQGRVRRQDGVVWLHHGRRHLKYDEKVDMI